jgi:hypothetical protein
MEKYLIRGWSALEEGEEGDEEDAVIVEEEADAVLVTGSRSCDVDEVG